MNDDLIQLATQLDRDATDPKLWTTGQTLRISFIETSTDKLKQAIYGIACEWLKYANLNFELIGDNESSAEIRIHSIDVNDETDSVSDIATLEAISPNMTIVLEAETPSDPAFIASVLKEFGSALGMQPAQSHPEANIPWNFDSMREMVRSEQDKAEKAETSDDEIDQEILSRMVPMSNQVQIALGYDPMSIMHDPISAQMTMDGRETALNTTLSEKDQQFMTLVYPGHSKA